MSTYSIPFVLDGFPRTASTTLTRILNSHPEIECCMEPFHPKRFGGEFNRLSLKNNNVVAALDLIRLRWNGLKHVWEPGSGWPFVGQCDLNDDLIRHAQIVVTLRRRNLLRQFVSGYISKRLGFWVGTSAEFYSRLDSACLPPINLEEMKVLLAEATDALNRRDQLLHSLPAKQLILFYEDIFEATEDPNTRAGFCNWLFVQLGHRPLDDIALTTQCLQYFDPTKYRWANNDVYARIPGSHTVDKELGNDVTGRLFI